MASLPKMENYTDGELIRYHGMETDCGYLLAYLI